MPTNPTWEETTETLQAPTWEDTTAEAPPSERDLAREELHRQMREARAEGIGGKVISDLADLGERAAYTLADALGRADVTGITGNILARQGVQRTPTLLQPEDIGTLGKFAAEGLHLPTTAPVEASQGVVPDILKGAKEFGTEMAVGLSDPGMIAMGGAAAKIPREMGRLFQLQMAAGLPQGLQDVAAAETLPEAVKGGLGVAANVAFPAAIERGLQPKLKPVPDISGRALPMREGAKPPTAERQAQLAVEEQLPPEEALTAPPTTKLTPEAERALAEAEAQPPPEPPAPKPAEGAAEPKIYEKQPTTETTVSTGVPVLDRGSSELRGERSKIDELRESAQRELAANGPSPVVEAYGKSISFLRLRNEGLSIPTANGILSGKIPIEQAVKEMLAPFEKKVGESPNELVPVGHDAALKQAYEQANQRLNDILNGRNPDTGSLEIEPTPPPVSPGEGRAKQPWYESAGEETKQRIFATMREIQGRVDAAAERERFLRPRQGEIAAGATGFDEFVRSEAQAQVLRAIRKGETPEQAEAQAKAWAREAVAIHNKKRPKDENWQRHEGTADSTIEWAVQQLRDSAKPSPAQPPPQPSAGAGKGAEVPLRIVEEETRTIFVEDGTPQEAQNLANTRNRPVVKVDKDGNVLEQYNPIVEKTAKEQFVSGTEWEVSWREKRKDQRARFLTEQDAIDHANRLKNRGVKTSSISKVNVGAEPPTPAAQTVGEAKPGQVEPGPGAMTVGEPPKPQIEQLTDAFKGIEATKPTIGERVQEAFRLGERLETAKDAFSKALSGLRSTGDYLIGKWRGVEKIDDLLRAKGQLSAQIESRGWRTRAFLKQARKAIPRQRDQAAIAKWIDAGGDRAELERGMRETLPKYRQAYEDALNLKGDLVVAAQNAQNYFESRLAEAIDAGVLKAGVEDYIHRIYESRPNLRDKALAYVQTGILKPNPALARRRVFQFDWEAEKLGYKPVQSFITRLATYESSLAKAIASREFIRKATAMRAEDGRPIIDIKGEGIPIEDPVTGEREATLIKPAFNPSKNAEQYLPDGTLNPNYRGDYVNKEFPALSRWKWVSKDAAGKPIFVQGDVAIHPDYANRVTALLEPSRLRYGKYGHIFRPALKASAAFKQTMLDLSGFHQVQITAHGLEHKVLPWRIIKDIDFADPNVDVLLKGGVTLGGDTPAFAAEGLVGASLTRQVPFLGPLMESYHQWLFQSYIPRIKMTMALHALERNRKRYAGQMSEEQIAFKTAQQANSAFGELNYVMLERSKTTQDIARMIFLAPDFLEARSRFAAEAFAKGGKSKVPGFGNEQRAALLLGALTLYITARIANKMLNDQYHFEPENAFSIVHNGRAFSLRTVQGDLLHLMERPVQFWMNRLNPVFGRTMLEIGTGRDYFGRKVNPLEALWDNAKNIVPISLRHGRERKLWESMMNSFGFTARRWNDVDDAFTLAKKWKDEQGIGEKGEFIYDPDKDPLRGLKLALNYGTEDAAAAEIKKLMESGYNRGKLVQYFKRYGTMPFTGSFANDNKWMAGLTEDERKTVESARAHKIRIRDKYFQSQAMYDAAAAAPKPKP